MRERWRGDRMLIGGSSADSTHARPGSFFLGYRGHQLHPDSVNYHHPNMSKSQMLVVIFFFVPILS
jgi:hypothetical protein